MKNELGELIKDVRLSYGISQSQLAEGICTQALISKIESGGMVPSIEISLKLGQRLNIPLTYFAKKMQYSNIEYVDELHHQIKILSRDSNYYEIYQLIKNEKKGPQAKNIFLKQLLMWQEGICIYYLEKDADKSLNMLLQSLQLTDNSGIHSEREIEIMNSIGIIHSEEADYDQAITMFQQAHECIKKMVSIQDFTIEIKVLYNTSKVYTQLGKYTDSTEMCQKGVQICLHNESSYLLGELHYQMGYNAFLEENYEQAAATYMKALSLFELQNFQGFADITRQEIEKINKLRLKTSSKANSLPYISPFFSLDQQ